MLENIKDKECNSSNLESKYSVETISTEEYHDTIEFRTIKKLIYEENLEYVTEYLRNLLSIKKENNPNCFRSLLYPRIVSSVSNRNKTIIYVRLSVEDLEKSEGNVSKSILNQLLMLLTYCNKKNLDVVGVFYEEDISGGDGTRTEWNKSLLFCELGNTDVYICKSQSRFARSIEFVEKYLHKKFIEWEIRFLSIVDNIDTNNKGNKKSSQITAMTDEWKIEEQSVNTKKTLRAKNNAGQWTGSFAPYGYIEDPNDMYHMVVDEQAAKNVKKIYELYANGSGYSKICKNLNERKIPTPSKYKKLQGSKFVCGSAPNGSEYWNHDTIRKILMDETYDGLLIQHRTETISYNVKGVKKIPKDEQCIVACSHERIVDPNISKIVRAKFKERKEKKLLEEARNESRNLIGAINTAIQNTTNKNTDALIKIKYEINKLEELLLGNNSDLIIEKFNKVRELTATLDTELYIKIQDNTQILSSDKTRSKPDKDGNIHIFSRKVYCKCCGKVFQKNQCKSGPRKNPTKKAYLQCRNNNRTGGIACDNKNSIRYEILEEIVLEEINKMISKYFDKTKLENNYYEKKVKYNYQNDIESLKKESTILNKKIASNNDKFPSLYDDKESGIITVDEFIILKNKYENDNENYKQRIKEINIEIIELENKKEQDTNETAIFEKYKKIDKLDRMIVETFIEKIIIGKKDPETQKRDIRIIWNINV